MAKQPLLCHLLVFRTRLSVVGVWIDADATTWGDEQFGRLGGIVPEPEEIVEALKKMM